MPFPTYAVSTELDAVNQILSSVGQAPVTTLDLQNPEVAIAVNTLREVSKQVQVEGWTFNTERKYTLSPDSSTKQINYPANMLRIDANEEEHKNEYDLVRRGGKVYDRLNHTNEFNNAIKVDVVWLFDYYDLPPGIQAYITAKAARMCATKMVGDKELNALLQEQELMTRAAALEEECQQGDYSMFGFQDGNQYQTTYQPFHAMQR